MKSDQPFSRGRKLATGHGYCFTEWNDGGRIESTLEMFLPIESAPINEVMRKMGKSLPAWKAKMIAADKMRRFYGDALSLALIGFDPPLGRVAELRIRSYRWNLCDHDGLVAGLKYLLDRLRDMRVIVDDSERWIGRPDVHQMMDRKNRRTEVVVEYLRPEALEQESEVCATLTNGSLVESQPAPAPGHNGPGVGTNTVQETR